MSPPPSPEPSAEAEPEATTMLSSSPGKTPEESESSESSPTKDNNDIAMIQSTASAASSTTTTTTAVKHEDNSTATTTTNPLVKHWRSCTHVLHRAILAFVVGISLRAARYPKRCIAVVSIISLAMMGIGLATNFELALDDERIFAPDGCRPREHFSFIDSVAGYPTPHRPLLLVVHAHGDNVLGYEGMRRMFEATTLVRQLETYPHVCGSSSINNEQEDCRILGPTRYWYHNQTLFDEETQGSDDTVQDMLSQDTFAGGVPAAHSYFLGNLERATQFNFDVTSDNLTATTTQGGKITYAESYLTGFELPNLEASENPFGLATMDFETMALEALLDLREEWANEEPAQPFRLEVYTPRSVPDEMTRAVASDLPLLPLVFTIMALFTCLVFFRRDQVQSRALLGIGSVVTIVCSIMTGFGFSFILGLPFTNLTQVLPFVIFGVGLDDTFIIAGAYLRTDPSLDTVLRIQHTMEEIGASISLTTITTTLAFAMGFLTSSIPTIQWLCLYALFTISIDFIYQISFFVAIVVLDEQRIQANRRDCCICITVPRDDDDDKEENHDNADNEEEEDNSNAKNDDIKDKQIVQQPSLPERFMEWYCDQLLRPAVKVFVLVSFTVFLGGCIYSATLLTQEFKPAEFMPDGSYALSFIESTDLYTNNKLRIAAFFRNVDQSDPEVQRQMIQYIEDMSALPQIQSPPNFCWVTDFQKFKDGSIPEYADLVSILNSGNLTFSEQLDLMLATPQINEVYGNDIAFNEAGEIESSRCYFSVNFLDLDVVNEQTDFLAEQRQLTASQPVNQGRADFAFFNFDPIYFLWEFYSVAIDELIFTTISGVLAVTFVAFLLIPHWTASLFVFPMMVILYVDLLGTLQFAGMHINPLVYICLIMAIGLLVDFLMHILLRYYESTAPTREEKVKDTLKTMGASILVGGLSTCLGVIPLAFSTSGIIQTVFVLFVSMITLGVGHGLIFLPVVLSYVGPIVCIQGAHQSRTSASSTEEDVDDCGSGSEGGGSTRDSASEIEKNDHSKHVRDCVDWDALTEIDC